MRELRRRFKKLSAEVADLALEEFVVNEIRRDKLGRFAATAASAFAGLAHAEHAAKEWTADKLGAAVAKLPSSVQKVVRAVYTASRFGTSAAFATWTASQKLAERVAVERGYTPEKAKRLRGVLGSVDIAAMKPVQIGLAATGAGAAMLGAASFVPPATASYLLYSTARNPMATMRAARGLVKDAVKGTVGRFKRNIEGGTLIEALESHDFDDWYIALLSVAMDETGDVFLAIDLADSLFTTRNAMWSMQTTDEKLASFEQWLQTKVGYDVLKGKDLWQKYIQDAFQKGAGKGAPPSVERVQILASQAYKDLKGVTEAMQAQMVRVLADGFVQGKTPKEIAKDLQGRVSAVGLKRAEDIAHTSIVKAHAEGQLAGMKAMGVAQVGVKVEWTTATNPCKLCAKYKGKVFSIDDASGRIPAHVRCRCAWIPAKSSVLNVFCPTGKGGGVDPHCSPGGASTGGVHGLLAAAGVKLTKVQAEKIAHLNPTLGSTVHLPKGLLGQAEQIAKALPPGTELSFKNTSGLLKGGAPAPVAPARKRTPSPAAPAAPVSDPASAGLPHPSTLKVLKTLPGSTHPKLTEDPSGKKWVLKQSSKQEHLRNEADADAAYRALGVPTPRSGIVGDAKVSEYLEGARKMVPADYPQVAKHFVADAVLANWDVVGLEKDNILVHNGVAHRIDNGGALAYRAQGAKKGAAFGPAVLELHSMRDPKVNKNTADVFKHLTAADIQQQARDVLAKREALLQAVTDPHTRSILEKRLDWLQQNLPTLNAFCRTGKGGYGSFRVGGMRPVASIAELKRLLDTKRADLPEAAK